MTDFVVVRLRVGMLKFNIVDAWWIPLDYGHRQK